MLGLSAVVLIVTVWFTWLPFIPPPPRLPLQRPRAARPRTVRVGVQSIASKITKMVRPGLPIDVRRLGIKGTVVLEVKVDQSFNVSVLRVVQGHPILHTYAERAVNQWKYEPALFQGERISIITTVVVNFD